MKRCVFSFGIILLLSAILWSCSTSSDNNLDDDLSLVQSMEVNANALSDAVLDISESEGFKIITLDDGAATKSDSRVQAEINIDDINGIYDYVQTVNDEQSFNRFSWVEDSEDFILRLPKEKAMNPAKFYVNEDADYVNDFVITTSDYTYSYSAEGFNYLLDSNIKSEDEYVGDLYVAWSIIGDIPIEYKSEFAFANDYSVGVEYGFGEVLSFEFSLKRGDDLIYQEDVEIPSLEGGLEYSITLGDIKIVVNSESETYKVYRNGVLEEGVTIQIIQGDEEDEAVDTFFRKGMDVNVTFENGDIINLSDFISEDTLELMDEVFSAMFDIKFVKHIVDKAALEVYKANSDVED